MEAHHIERLSDTQRAAIDETDVDIRRFKTFRKDYDALKKSLLTLPDKLKHDIMVPIGTQGFIPGHIVRTNEVCVLLGDNVFADRSAKQAAEIVDRRVKTIDEQISDLMKQRDLISPRVDVTDEFHNIAKGVGDTKEIQEDYNEEAEMQWQEAHIKSVQRYYESLKKEKIGNPETSEQNVQTKDYMQHLEELEKQEKDNKEMEMLPDKSSDQQTCRGDVVLSDSSSRESSESSEVGSPGKTTSISFTHSDVEPTPLTTYTSGSDSGSPPKVQCPGDVPRYTEKSVKKSQKKPTREMYTPPHRNRKQSEEGGAIKSKVEEHSTAHDQRHVEAPHAQKKVSRFKKEQSQSDSSVKTATVSVKDTLSTSKFGEQRYNSYEERNDDDRRHRSGRRKSSRHWSDASECGKNSTSEMPSLNNQHIGSFNTCPGSDTSKNAFESSRRSRSNSENSCNSNSSRSKYTQGIGNVKPNNKNSYNGKSNCWGNFNTMNYGNEQNSSKNETMVRKCNSSGDEDDKRVQRLLGCNPSQNADNKKSEMNMNPRKSSKYGSSKVELPSIQTDCWETPSSEILHSSQHPQQESNSVVSHIKQNGYHDVNKTTSLISVKSPTIDKNWGFNGCSDIEDTDDAPSLPQRSIPWNTRSNDIKQPGKKKNASYLTDDWETQPPSEKDLVGQKSIIIVRKEAANTGSDVPEMLSFEKDQLVFFDLETTGLNPHHAHILQICARHEDNDCTRYVTPIRTIQKKAGEVNGIAYDCRSKVMTYKSNEVQHISLHKALEDFLDFLADIKNPVLVSHNGKSFDFIILYRVAAITKLLPRFKLCVYGFLDSLPLCRNLLRGHPKYSLTALYSELLKEDFEAHDALEDCKALEKILAKMRTSSSVMQRFSFGWETVMDMTVRDPL